MLDGIPCLLDDDIQEVMNSNVPSDGNAKLDSTNSITGEGGDGQSPKKITCPICLEDERTVSKEVVLLILIYFSIWYFMTHKSTALFALSDWLAWG